jgi:hypothetical protein
MYETTEERRQRRRNDQREPACIQLAHHRPESPKR